MVQQHTRRNFFKGAGGAVGLLGALPASSSALFKSRSFDEIVRLNQVFRHGIASGDPLHDRVIIWTRISELDLDQAWVRWQLANDPEFSDLVQEGEALCERARDYTVKVDVDQLEGGRTYYYRFRASDVWSMVGRTKTAPIDSQQIRVGVVSCSSIWSGYMNAYDRLADRNDLDLIIHCGDYIYEIPDPDERLIMPHDPIDEMKPRNLEEMRRRYAYYRLDPYLRRAHQQHPFSIIWDNHDLDIDGPIEFALQAFHEWTPTRSPVPGNDRYIYRHLSFGNLADVFLLDTRYVGRNQRIAGTGDPSILGDEQFDWLTDRLASSQAKWKILGNQVILAPFNIFGQPLSKAHWGGYPKDRERLLQFLADGNLENLVVVTGDAHMSIASDLRYGSKPVGVEFLPTSVSRGNIDETLSGLLGKIAVSAANSTLPLFNPLIRYIDTSKHGYGILDIQDEQATMEFWFTPILERSSYQVLGQALKCESGTQRLKSVRDPQPTSGQASQPAPEELRAFLKTASYGGMHGMRFDHEMRLPWHPVVEEIWIRAGARLDQLGLRLKQGHIFKQGGEGGSGSSMLLAPGEMITEVELSTGSHQGRTKVFYIRLGTNFGRFLEGGRKQRDHSQVSIPKGWHVVGFFGRSGAEIDKLGFVLSRM